MEQTSDGRQLIIRFRNNPLSSGCDKKNQLVGLYYPIYTAGFERYSYDHHKMGKFVVPWVVWPYKLQHSIGKSSSLTNGFRSVALGFVSDRLMHQKQMQILKRLEMELGRRR